MSGAIGGGAVNLATLWVPVLPEVSGFTSKLAEAVVGGATMAIVDRFVGLFGEMAKKAAEGLLEIGKGIYEIGEQFQTLEYQVSSFTDAQGAALESLQNTAAQVFSQLDTGTKNLGENMDVFHQRLGVTGESLRQLTYDYTELTSRLGNVDPRAFTAALDAYGVSGDKADAALRTLAADSRHYADTMSNLTTQLETANPVFDLLGIGFNGAAEAMAKIDAIGPNAMKAMNGIAMSGKAFAKLPNGSEDFRKFISDAIDAIDYYNAHGESAKAQQFAWDTFGTRQAPIVLRSLKTIKEAFEGAGAAGRQLNVDEFVESTRKLDQTWELFIHRLEFDLKPIGDTALKGLETGVKWLGDFLTAHEGEIVNKITGWGDAFIQALPSIQHFVGVGISLLGDFFQFMNVGTQAMLSNVGLIMQAWGTLTGDDSDIKMGQNLLDMANQLNKVDLSKFTDGIAKLIEAPTIDTAEIQKKWDEAMGRVRDQASKDHGSLGASIDVSIDPKAPDGSALTDPKQLFPGLSTDGTLHLPTTLEPPDNRPPPPPDAPRNSKGEVIITQDSPVTGGFGGGPNQPSWMPSWLASILGYGSDSLTPKANADTSAFNPGPRAPGSGAAAAPGIVHTGDPSDPVHVAVVLSAFSAPLGDPGFTQVPGGGWGRGGGGASHSANKGYGSLGPGAPANVYDAPTDYRNQLPGKKGKSADPGDLLGPLLDMLGFGNALGGVNPEDWGIVKLFKGLAGYLSGPGRGSGGGSGGSSSGGGGSPLMDALGLGNLFPQASTGPAPGPAGPDDGSGGTGGPPPSAGGFTPGQIPGHPMGPGHLPWYPPKTSYDQGGVLPPGDTHATNQTGGPEVVIPAGQLPAGMHQGPNGKWATDASAAQIQGAIIAGAQARNMTPDQIHAILATVSDESAFGQNAYGGDQGIGGAWGVLQQGKGYGPVADRQDPNKAIKSFLDQAQTQFKAYPNQDPFKVITGIQQHGGPGSPGVFTGSSGDEKYLREISSPENQAAANQAIAAAKTAGGAPPGAPGAPGSPPGAPNPMLNALKSWFSGGAAPGSVTPGFNPLTFGLDLGPNTPPPGAKSPPGAVAQNPYTGIFGDTGPTATPGAIASTSNPKYGGIPNAPSGKGDAVDAFMLNVMNAYNAEHGTHLKVTADYPGGPTGHPDDGADHSVRRALDFSSDNPREMNDFAAYWYNNPSLRAATRQLIHDPEWDKAPGNTFTGDMNIIGGHSTPGSQTYAGAPYAPGPSGPGHADHDHIALQYIPPEMASPNGQLVSAAPNIQPQLGGGPGAQAERRGDTHIHGDYMPMKVTPSAIDPKPAVTAMQNHQNAMVGSAGGFGGLPK